MSKITALLVLEALIALSLHGQAKATQTEIVYKVEGIHAYLFYETLGSVDDRDLVSGRFALWNTIIGAGDAKGPSNTTMIVVDLTGPSFVSGTKGTVKFSAKNGTRVLRRETVSLESFFSETGKLSIPFLVVGTGCSTLTVDVGIAVKGKTHAFTKKLEYPCGE